MSVLRPLILLGLVAAHGAQADSVTPVQKVTSLLDKLAKVIEQEGKEEAAAYDKYACFCKQQSDEKQYAIESSTEKITMLTGKIDALDAEINTLNGEIRDLGTQIVGLAGEIQNMEVARQASHATFLAEQANAANAIDAVQRAIDALTSSKSALSGKAELEAETLAQVRALPGLPREVLLQLGEPGEAYSYKYHSNDIIATLQTLQQTFAQRKLGVEEDEFKAKKQFDIRKLSLSNEKKFAAKEKAEKEELSASKSEVKEALVNDRADEQRDMGADQNFLRVLQGDCEAKAGFWDQRSTTRANELTAIGKAVDALKEGVAPNWKANKKLAGLQTPASSASAPSFLQIYGQNLRGNAGMQQATIRAQDFLADAAQSLGSPVLSVVAIKIGAAQDHFVKVRQIIKDLMQQLEDEADSETTRKGFCDDEMAKALDQRDTEQSKVEDFDSQIAGKEADRAGLKRDIAALSAQIAENKKALLDATTLRQAQEAENTKTLADAREGKTSVELAIQVLTNFYGFVQRSAHVPFVPTDSDREGQTVGDRSPEIFNSDYHGNQDASKGIIGILQVILADFDRTLQQVQNDEDQAGQDFTSLKSSNEADTSTKEGSVATKEGEVTNVDAALLDTKSSQDASATNHKNAETELSKLHTMCIQGEETYAERVATRNKEIEALKQALNILEEGR